MAIIDSTLIASGSNYAGVSTLGALKVDGSAVTQPVSGSVNIGSIAAGTNNIGDVDIASIAAGTALIGKVSIDQVTANANEVVTKTGSTTVVSSLTAALPAGTNNIGDVDIVSGTITTVSTVTNVAQQGGVAISLNTGVRDTGTQRVTIATNDIVPVTDNAGSLTVDAPLATPVNVQIGNATLAAGVIDETGASAVDALAVGGGSPHDSVDSGNPIKVGFKALSTLPTAVASADRANGISDLWGRQLVSHIDPAMQLHKAFNATTTQAGTDVITPSAGKRLAITSCIISTYATTGGRIILWFGDNADTTYTAGTDQVLAILSAVPSATQKPGLVYTPATPVFCTTADRELHITTDGNISIDVVLEYYEY